MINPPLQFGHRVLVDRRARLGRLERKGVIIDKVAASDSIRYVLFDGDAEPKPVSDKYIKRLIRLDHKKILNGGKGHRYGKCERGSCSSSHCIECRGEDAACLWCDKIMHESRTEEPCPNFIMRCGLHE